MTGVPTAERMPDLLGHRRKHFLRRRPARHSRRDPPQRRLLVGNLTQPCPIGRITAHPPVGGMACTDGGIWHVHMADGSPVPSGRQRAIVLIAADTPRLVRIIRP
jgi:transposase InsO family protein